MLRSGSKLGRLKKRSEFLYVRDGTYAARPGLVVQCRAHPERTKGIAAGFTATKKVGNAVIRNRAKRRLRELARTVLPTYGQPGYDYVFIARDQTANIAWESLLIDAQKALLRLHNKT